MNFKTRTADFSGLAVIEKKICLKRDLLLAFFGKEDYNIPIAGELAVQAERKVYPSTL